MPRRIFALAFALALAVGPGCYRSHEREGGAGRDAGRRGDAGPRADAGADGGPDAFVPRCRGRWEASRELEITDPPGDDLLLDAATTAAGTLVAYISNNPDRDQTRYTRLIGPDDLLPPLALFDPPAGSYGGVSLAVSGGEVAAATWDERGCLFRRVAADGAPLAAAVPLGREGCVGLTAVPGGYTLLDYPGGSGVEVDLRRLAFDGRVVAGPRHLPLFDGEVFWWGRARFEDASQLLVAMRGGVVPESAWAQRVDPEGEALGPEVPLPAFAAANRARAIDTSAGALIGWLEEPGGDPDSQERQIRLIPTTRDGRPTAEGVLLPGVRAYRDGGWSMARFGEDLFLAYVEPEPGDRFGDRTMIRLLRVDAEGRIRDPEGPLTVAEARFGRRALLRTDGVSLWVLYNANAGSSTEVFAVELRCAVE